MAGVVLERDGTVVSLWVCVGGPGRPSCGGVPVRLLGVLWRCPTLPQPVGCSTIGAAGLSFQVRNGAGRFPGAVTTTSFVVQPPPRGLRCCASRLAAGGWGVWVDRGLYSGCGLSCTARPLVGGGACCCLVLAH